ncbi:MAG: hypothetical protein ABSE63_04760 [Thermoguttaceae bacterium]|jgi:hypothetical protein
MKDVTTSNFGLLIAYLLPGFVVLWGMSYLVPPTKVWLGTAPSTAPTVGGFLYITIAAVGAGMIASTLRWLIIDTFHHWTGVQPGKWDFTQLQNNVTAFDVLGENHYRYYQFYGSSSIALPFWYVARWISTNTFWPPPLGWGLVGILALEVLLLAGSRDTLRKYYGRMSVLLRNKIEEQ